MIKEILKNMMNWLHVVAIAFLPTAFTLFLLGIVAKCMYVCLLFGFNLVF